MVKLPMGWTNSVPIFHDDVTWILQAEIPHVTIPYVDDVPVKGPASDHGRLHDYQSRRKNLTDRKLESRPESEGD